MERSLERPQRSVDAQLTRLRLAASALLALRALLVGAGAAAAAFALAALLVGPIATPWAASVGWIAVAAAGLVSALRSAAPARAIRGGGVARLLRHVDPWLASAARTSFELGQGHPAACTSQDLAQAHHARVREALGRVHLRRALPWSWLRDRSVPVALILALAAAAGLTRLDRAKAGTYALLHPSARANDGDRYADVVARTRAHLTFPAYMARASRDLPSADRLECPRGTTVEYAVRTRIEAREARLRVGEREIPLTSRGNDTFSGRFVVRGDAPLSVRILDGEGRWLTDPKSRAVAAIADQPPAITLGPRGGTDPLPLGQVITLAYEARDDHGLARVTRVLRGADGREHRSVLLEPTGDPPTTRHEGVIEFALADIDAQPGDRITLFLEAQDGDVVAGPNVGRSEERVLVVDSEATRRARVVESLSALVALGVDALADRLESPVPDGARGAQTRFEKVEASTLGFAGGLEARTAPDATGEAISGADGAVLRDLATRLRRLVAREARLHRGHTPPRARRAAADERVVAVLEEGLLALDDRVARARIDDAAELARELEGLRREMTSLLAELRRTESAEARSALLAALARAQQRMEDLAARVGALSHAVPSEFVNIDSLEEAVRPDRLAAMREAIERGDLAEAERNLLGLESQIDALASMLGEAESDFGQARFGPRDRALAEALDALGGLEAEQRELARRSDAVRRGAAERALERAAEAPGERQADLAEQARAVREGLEEIPPSLLGPMDEETLRAARQRALDAEDALRTGDLGEARRMAGEALGEAAALARDLELSALMFPGRRGEIADAARRARAAANDLRSLGVGIDRALPRMADFLSAPERQRMSSDASRQQRVVSGAERLARDFAASPDGAPLSEDAAASLRTAQESMRQAQRALRQGDPVEAARTQEEASRRLSEIRESLERDSRPQGASGGGSGGGRGALRNPNRRVEIPRAGAERGPVDRRRRILDAMGESPPAGYEDAVRRYYEELLR